MLVPSRRNRRPLSLQDVREGQREEEGQGRCTGLESGGVRAEAPSEGGPLERHPGINRQMGTGGRQSSALRVQVGPQRPQGGHGDAQGRVEADEAGKGMVRSTILPLCSVYLGLVTSLL